MAVVPGGVNMRNHNDTPSQARFDRPAESWGGVLPPPEVLKRYEDIVPGAASRILQAVEQEQRHRQSREREAREQETLALETAQEAQVKGAQWRFISFLVIYALSILGIAGGIYIILVGPQWWGLAVCVAHIAAMLAAFVFSADVRSLNRLPRARTSESNERTG